MTSHETTRRRTEQQRRLAERAAAHDTLTGLPNRASLEQRLRRAIMTCGPEERVAVLFCDLDHLRAVNDSHGHAAGDAVLKAVADRLAGCLHTDQTAARISGDEFALVLPGLPPTWQPAELLDALHTAVERPVHTQTTDITPTLTIGCHLADPATVRADRDPADVLAAADKAMYAARNARRRDH